MMFREASRGQQPSQRSCACIADKEEQVKMTAAVIEQATWWRGAQRTDIPSLDVFTPGTMR
jgi:hypothetical protein